MKDRKEPPVPSDADFKQAVEGVTPLPSSGRVERAAPPRHAPVRQAPPTASQLDSLSDHFEGDETPAEFARNGISRMTLRKLKHGHWPVQDSLDLHGLRSDDARRLLLDFLRQATERGLRCVCIVHGKGWHTQGGEGVLKIRSRHWLTQCPEVLAFCEPPQHAGGGGAVWVLLKAEA